MNDAPKRMGRPPKIKPQIEESADDLLGSPEPGEVLPEPEELSEEILEESIVDSFDTRVKESPIEEKIHQLVESQPVPAVLGWDNNMHTAPQDGRRIMVSFDAKGTGSLVYWRVSKFVDKKNLRYVPRGRWTDFITKLDITFVPKYWKPYDPEAYWPLTV